MRQPLCIHRAINNLHGRKIFGGIRRRLSQRREHFCRDERRDIVFLKTYMSAVSDVLSRPGNRRQFSKANLSRAVAAYRLASI
jgi:hypothetical protein